MTESRIEKLTRIGQEMAAAVDEMRAEAVDVTPDLTAKLAIRQIEGEAAWWRSVGHDRSASRTFDSMTGDSQQAVRTGVERVLAHLQSAGRLIPAGGMALTAEQVEDVEALVATANPYSAPAARLRALFPVTEPAEPAASEGVNCGANSVVLGWCTLSAQHEGLHTNGTYFWGQAPAPAEPAEEVKPVKFRKMTPKYATDNFGFPDVTVDPFTPFTRWAYKDSDGDKWAWNGDQWELHVVPPAPAEPAEDIRGLIEKSSLGTESAQALISTVSPEHGRRVAQEAARREAGTKVKLTELQRDLLQRIVDQWTKGAGWTHVFWSGTVEALISASCIVRHEEAFNEYRPTIFGEKALAPAEPTEEETKAELCSGGGDMHPCVLSAGHAGVHTDSRGLRWNYPASSPVVPAPTETGPWQTWQEVPEGVQYYGINGWGPTYYVNRGGVRYRVFDDTPSKTADYVVQNFAPFVAAAEEG